MVFQHFMLADNLTVLENVVLGAERHARHRRQGPRRDQADLRRLRPRHRARPARRGARRRRPPAGRDPQGPLPRRPDRSSSTSRPPSWCPQEVDELFGNLRELKAEGLTVIFISHKLDEVLSVADEITVDPARHHRRAPSDTAGVTARQLAELMVGSELPSPSTETSTVTDQVLLERRPPEPARATRAARCSTTSPSRSTAARSSASPASRATARPSWSRRSWACARAPAASSGSAAPT